MSILYSLFRQAEGSQAELIAQFTDRADAVAALRDMTVDDLGDMGMDDVISAGNESDVEGCAVLWVEAGEGIAF